MITQNPPRKRIQLKCPEISITDPDENRVFSMANIKKRLDNGQMPTLTNDSFYSLQPLKYTNLQDALDFHQQVTQDFQSLPSELRKLMGNNIHNFESFIADPQNSDTLLKYGLKTKRDASNQEVVDSIQKLSDNLKPEPPKKGQE